MRKWYLFVFLFFYVASANASSLAIPLPGTVMVPLNARNGDHLTDWIYSQKWSGTYKGGRSEGVALNYSLADFVENFESPNGSGSSVVVSIGHGMGVAFTGRALHSDGHWGPWLGMGNDPGPWRVGDSISVQLAAMVIRLPGNAVPGTVNMSRVHLGVYWSDDDKINAGFPNFEAVAPTCQIQTNNVDVPIGNDISTSKFTGPGTTSDPRDFKVSMTCQAGMNKLSYQMNEAGGSSIDKSQPGTLSLSNKNGASGVGVQVRDKDNNAFVNFGQNTPVGQYRPDRDNQHIDLDFEAAYIQTGATVTGGEADAKATITLSYE
ncbi:fimbrial protein (plasmid) [Burkholderia pyrrocinia]|uniref:fimbrial protein n=1 Tax=Burkholderia pyrrocinia TaxID=60550 RepID=UPI0038B5B7DA